MGTKIYQTASKYIKPVSLELGGSDAFIVLKDCDIDKAIDTAYLSWLNNTGQQCNAAKRFFIEKEIFQKFQSLLIEKIEKNKNLHHPYSILSKQSLEDKLKEQLQSEFELIYGDTKKLNEPMILIVDNVDHKLFKEEVFGPIFVLKIFKDFEEVNWSLYGLNLTIFTQNKEKIDEAIKKSEVGSVYVN